MAMLVVPVISLGFAHDHMVSLPFGGRGGGGGGAMEMF